MGKGAGSPAWHKAIGKLGTTIYGRAGCHTCMHFLLDFLQKGYHERNDVEKG